MSLSFLKAVWMFPSGGRPLILWLVFIVLGSELQLLRGKCYQMRNTSEVGSRIPAPSSRLLNPGSQISAPGSRILTPGSRILAPRSWLQVPRQVLLSGWYDVALEWVAGVRTWYNWKTPETSLDPIRIVAVHIRFFVTPGWTRARLKPLRFVSGFHN